MCEGGIFPGTPTQGHGDTWKQAHQGGVRVTKAGAVLSCRGRGRVEEGRHGGAVHINGWYAQNRLRVEQNNESARRTRDIPRDSERRGEGASTIGEKKKKRKNNLEIETKLTRK